MRAAARISGLICEFIGGHRLDGLSHTTVQNYLLRVGLDQIQNSTESSDNRFWIVDHIIAAGPLQHQDVEVIALIPTKVSNGTVVNKQLTELALRRGVPRAILNDCG